MNELLPSFQEEDADAAAGGGGELPNGHMGHARAPSSDAAKLTQGVPLFPEVDALLALFKDSCKELVDLRQQVCNESFVDLF